MMDLSQVKTKGFHNVSPFTVALFIHKHYWVIAAVVIVLIGGLTAFPASYFSNMNVLLGMLLVPFATIVQGTQRTNYLILAGVFLSGLIAALYPVKIFYFFAIACFMMLLVERHIGRINAIAFFLLLWMSPFFEQVAGILGFPIRLYLSSLAGNMLRVVGMEITVEGNMMVLNGNSFTVDDACMGLNMLSTSLLIGVMMVCYHYRAQKKLLSFLQLLLFFLSIALFNIICNLARIVTLVLFNIGPTDFMHEVVGLACFVVYGVVPVYALAGWMVRRFSNRIVSNDHSYHSTPPFIKISLIGVATGLLWIGITFPARMAVSIKNISTELSNEHSLQTEYLDDGVTKLSNNETLIYLKPIAEFFSGEHTPLFCWRGSGYTFRHIRKATVNGREMYFGEMVKPEGKLVTAWWYSNGQVTTIDQFDWRFRMMKGERPFHLVNITAPDKATVEKYVTLMLEEEKAN